MVNDGASCTCSPSWFFYDLIIAKKLVNAKATGVHNIPNKILKDSCQTIAPFLSDIFNLSISTNTFPNDLKIGKVSPAHKSGDRG